MAENVEVDPKAGFAQLMSQAHDDARPEAAPYGFTTDKDGTTRPKKSPGRPRKSPSVEELKAEREAADSDGQDRPGDRAPDAKASRRLVSSKSNGSGEKKPDPVPQFREGQIEKGINKLYRRAGKLIRVADSDIGQALIDITKKEAEDDVTVGLAWEEVCRVNPRIRKVVLKLIAGGAWGQLFMAHAPVLLAVLMKDKVREHIPFAKLIEAFVTSDEDGEAPADGTPLEGMTVPDFAQLKALAEQTAQVVADRVTSGGSPRPPTIEDFAAAMSEAQAQGIPPAFRRSP